MTVFGTGCAAFFDALHAGRSGLHKLHGIPVARGKDRSAQIEDPRWDVPHRAGAMALEAAREAIAQAGTTDEDGVTGLFVGTTGGDSRTLEDRWAEFLNAESQDTTGTDPALLDAVVNFPTGALADEVASELGLDGPRYVATNACASGTVAIALAVTALRSGRVDRAIVVGVDQVKASSYWGAERSGFIGHDLRPFHVDRDGSVLGDGAGVLVLERADTAAARGARSLAQVAGWAVSCDRNPQAIVPPEDGSDHAAAIRLALTDAAMTPDDIDYVNAHGTGTPLIDRLETASAKAVFGARAPEVPISSTKSLTGHLAAASPVIEAIATIHGLSAGWLHPTAHLDQIDPGLDLDYVPLRGRDATLRAAVSSSLGGGGTNAVIVLRSEHETAAPTNDRSVVDDVVVTGYSALSRFGATVEALEAAFDGADAAPSRATPFDVLDWIDRGAGYQHLSRCAQLGFAAAASAARAAGLEFPLTGGQTDPARVGVVMGTTLGGIGTWSALLCGHLLVEPRRITPNMALDHGPHLAATLIARASHATGPVMTLTSGDTAGLQAIETAQALLRADACDLVVVGGVDIADEPTRRAVTLLAGASAAEQCDDGAAALVLERAAHAQQRGATVRATLGQVRTWGAPVGAGQRDTSDAALAHCLDDVLAAVGDTIHHSYTVGVTEERVEAHARGHNVKLTGSTWSSERCGHTGAAGPLLATVAAAHRVWRDSAADAVVAATARGGAAAALTLTGAKR